MATQQSIIGLPDNVLSLIIENLIHIGSSPRPLITSCKSLHERFGYVLETVEMEEILSYQCFPKLTPQWRMLQHLTRDKNKTMCLQSLVISSHVPDLFLRGHTTLAVQGSRLYRSIPLILHTAHCLKSLELNCNTPLIVAKTLTYLPPRVENLCITVMNHELSSFEFDELLRTDMTLAMQAQTQRERGLIQFEFRVINGKKFRADLSKAFRFLEKAVEVEINDDTWERRFLLRRLEIFTEHYKVVSLIGELIYYIILCNSLTLESTVFEGIDVDLVFGQEESPPIQIPNLRIFQFDHTSNKHWHQWLRLFEIANMDNEPFEGMSAPLLVCRRKNRLHVKHISEDLPLQTHSRVVGGKSEMAYWRSVEEQPLTRYTLYKKLGLKYVFHGGNGLD